MYLRFLFDIQGHGAEVHDQNVVVVVPCCCMPRERGECYVVYQCQTQHELVHHDSLCILLYRLSSTRLVMSHSTTNHRSMMLSTTFVQKVPLFQQMILTFKVPTFHINSKSANKTLTPRKVITKHVCPERMADIAEG